MALHIERASQTPVGGAIADRRLCLTADRARVVDAEDSAAAFLLAPIGAELSADTMAAYGLTVVDGTIVLPGAVPESEPPPTPAPARKRRSA